MAKSVAPAKRRLGVAASTKNPTAEQTARDLAAAKRKAYIARALAEAPPLSPAQATRIARILNSVDDDGGDSA